MAFRRDLPPGEGECCCKDCGQYFLDMSDTLLVKFEGSAVGTQPGVTWPPEHNTVQCPQVIGNSLDKWIALDFGITGASLCEWSVLPCPPTPPAEQTIPPHSDCSFYEEPRTGSLSCIPADGPSTIIDNNFGIQTEYDFWYEPCWTCVAARAAISPVAPKVLTLNMAFWWKARIQRDRWATQYNNATDQFERTTITETTYTPLSAASTWTATINLDVRNGGQPIGGPDLEGLGPIPLVPVLGGSNNLQGYSHVAMKPSPGINGQFAWDQVYADYGGQNLTVTFRG